MTDADPFEPPIVRDKRRVHFDPQSGAVSQEPQPDPHGKERPASAGLSTADALDSIELAQLRTDLAERTADLQRLQAEYANYRKRVERDRASVRDYAVAEALAALSAGTRRHRSGPRSRRTRGRLPPGGRGARRRGHQARADQVRPARRPVRPHAARGADALLLRHGRRTDGGADPAARLQLRRSGGAAGESRGRRADGSIADRERDTTDDKRG